jgi:hypothetical protein
MCIYTNYIHTYGKLKNSVIINIQHLLVAYFGHFVQFRSWDPICKHLWCLPFPKSEMTYSDIPALSLTLRQPRCKCLVTPVHNGPIALRRRLAML